MAVSSNVVKGRWLQIVGLVRKQWSELTEDDMATIKGSDQKLIGRIMARYHCDRAEAERLFLSGQRLSRRAGNSGCPVFAF